METRAHHVLIGAFALLVMLGGMAFALWIGKSSLDREWHTYIIEFSEAVTGLTVGGAVQYNGIQVGEVRRLSLDPQAPAKVLAEVRIAADVPVKVDTRAKLTFTGLTGVALIQLSGGSLGAAPLVADNGEWPRIVADVSAIGQLLASSEDIATTTSQVLLRINRLLSEDNVNRVANTLAHIEQITAAAAEGRDDIRTVLSEAAAASSRLAELLDGADGMLRRLDAGVRRADEGLSREMPLLLAQLNQTLASLARVSAHSEALLRDNRGALDDFSQQGLAQVGPTLIELRRLIADLDRIAGKLEQSPPDFVLGRHNLPEYQPE